MPQRISPEYSAVPSVRPEGPPGLREGIQVHFPEVHLTGAVGEAMGAIGRGYGTLGKAAEYTAHALDGLGAQFEKTGNQLWERAVGLQQLENETEEKKRLIEYDRYATDKRLEYDMKLGDAVSKDTLKAFQDDLEAKRQQLKTGLPPTSQRSFDNNSIATAARDGIHAATHTASQMRQSAIGTSEASIKIAMDRFGKSDTPQDAQYYMDQVFKEIHNTYGPAQGWSQEQMDTEYQKRVGQMLATKFTTMADNDPTTGMALLEENRHLMPEETYVRVRHSLQEGMERQQSRKIGDEVEEKMKDANLEDKIKEAKKRAAELDPKNPELATKAADRVRVAHNMGRQELREQRERDYFTARDAAWGYTTPGGKKPKTHEELFVDPKVKEAYMNLKNPNDRHEIDGILVKNSKDDYPPTPETRARYEELDGESISPDPEARERFMHRDLSEEKIPASERHNLYEKQRAARKAGLNENPSVKRALRVAQIPSSIMKNESIKNRFIGTLRQAMEERMAEQKGVPLKDQEIREIVGNLLRADPNTGLWGFFQSRIYEGMSAPSDEDMRQIKNMFPYMSDDMVKDYHMRSKWKTFSDEYEKLKSGSKPPTWKPVQTAPKATVPTSQ